MHNLSVIRYIFLSNCYHQPIFMKKVYISFIALLLFKISIGQALVGKVEYQKAMQTAAVVELPFSSDLVEGAIKDYLAKKGSKANQSKGFTVFKNVQLASSDPTATDLYFKIDRKSKKENDVSVVYLLVAKPTENLATRSSEDNFGMEGAKAFLNEISPSITGYSLELQIKDQEEAVKKAEKRFNNLMDDQKDLESRKKGIEEKIQDNLKDQEKQKMEIEKQRQLLVELNGRRKA